MSLRFNPNNNQGRNLGDLRDRLDLDLSRRKFPRDNKYYEIFLTLSLFRKNVLSDLLKDFGVVDMENISLDNIHDDSRMKRQEKNLKLMIAVDMVVMTGRYEEFSEQVYLLVEKQEKAEK